MRQLAVLIGAVVQLDAARPAARCTRAGRGTIVNVASTAGFQPLPGKRHVRRRARPFVLPRTEALHDEARRPRA